ncbi:MAG TPA: CBS domain-containing protein [Anaerolineae bacterium]|nr:CBS domain-containing protein [Anaerolineae bacterium]
MAQTVSETTEKRVGDIMTTTVIKAQPETPVSEIARLMSQHGISGLPVVDRDNQVVGVVTELDMMARNTHFKLPSFIFIFDAMIPLETGHHYRERLEHVLGTTAQEIMSEPPVTITPDATIEELAELMVDRRINPIPVVENDRLVGVISRSDIIRLMAADFGSSPSN